MANFVTFETEESKKKVRNLFIIGIFIGFIWVFFHFMIVFFFWFILRSSFLVGIFLAIGNILAFFIDIPVWILQKYIPAKKMLFIANFLMMWVSLIFLKFIYFPWISEALPGNPWFLDASLHYVGEFLNSSLNIILLIVAACMYGIIKEVYDVTIIAYIFNHTPPSLYADRISKYNIRFWIGALLSFIAVGPLLLHIQYAVYFFVILIVVFSFFVWKFFDNPIDVEFEGIKNFRIDVIYHAFNEKERYMLSKQVLKQQILELSQKTKLIFLEPIKIKKQLNIRDIYHTTLEQFERFFQVFFWKPFSLILLWSTFLILQFGFWDTFVSTFQIDFLKKMVEINKENFLIENTRDVVSVYGWLLLLILPAFLFQKYFISLSKFHGEFKIITFWIFLSASSLMLFSFIHHNFYLLLMLGMLNSVWYAAVMPLAQAVFADMYNFLYARKYKLFSLDATISSAPLKMLLNFANIISLIFSWFIVSFFWFDVFFRIFSLCLFFSFFVSVLYFRVVDIFSLFFKPQSSLEKEFE